MYHHLVNEWNIVIFLEFNELKRVFHEEQPIGIQDFNDNVISEHPLSSAG